MEIFSSRLCDLATRRLQFIGGFIFGRRVKSAVVPILVGLSPIALTLRIMRGNWTSVPYFDEWWTPGRHIVSFLDAQRPSKPPLHGSWKFQDQPMNSGFADPERFGRSSGPPLAAKVGEFAYSTSCRIYAPHAVGGG